VSGASFSIIAALALVGVVIALAVIALYLTMRRREPDAGDLKGLAQSVSDLRAAQGELAGRLSQLAESQSAQQAALAQTLDARLEALGKGVNETLATAAAKTSETLTQVATRLAVIDEAQKNITALSKDVVGLQDILANKQARGAFGEIQLRDLVTQALPPSAYAFQATLSNQKRADCLIYLPKPPGPIAIDSKFPLESFHALRAAESDTERQAALRALRAAIIKHVEDIAARYIVPGETAESALLFLPSEAVYAEIHVSCPDVMDKCAALRVWIVAPTTLMATLNTVRAVLKDVQMREQASRMQREVGFLVDDVGRLQERVESLRKHFNQADGDIRQIEISTDKITSRGTRIGEAELGEPLAEATAPKLVSSS
jgi:DNA recombination protein RmuC